MLAPAKTRVGNRYFYSRPYARGDKRAVHQRDLGRPISTHAPTRGATASHALNCGMELFLLTPLREGQPRRTRLTAAWSYFYSRPYARGNRPPQLGELGVHNFYSRPYARGDVQTGRMYSSRSIFLLAPLREGRLGSSRPCCSDCTDFYSRPYARGDARGSAQAYTCPNFYSRPYARGGV